MRAGMPDVLAQEQSSRRVTHRHGDLNYSFRSRCILSPVLYQASGITLQDAPLFCVMLTIKFHRRCTEQGVVGSFTREEIRNVIHTAISGCRLPFSVLT